MQAECSRPAKTDLTRFREGARPQNRTRQIGFEVTAELYERMKARADEKRYSVDEWVLCAAIRGLYPPEFTMDRITLEIAWTNRPRLPPPRPAASPAAQPATERKPHAPHI